MNWSPSGYKYLYENKILPLPCVTSIRKHLRAVKIGCGFDEEESKSVNTKTLTYLGLEDFGDGFKDKSQDKANHALVLMLQSLADNVQQPIAIFAFKGPVKGVDISKIIVKAIFVLEDAGIQVMGITSDGATTNRTMWMKTVRNRLYAKRVLRYDSQQPTKVCLKVNKNHSEPNNLAKMKVKYATQIFSKSMLQGIQFYKSKNFQGFENCEETIEFTNIMNDLFDVLNRKFPAEGIREESKD
ncbi:THAP-type domain-containing protein, partial [Aphis craccivora]